MICKIAKSGASFKGAGLYYLHDKRQDNEATRTTSERVAWTETRNLMTDDADMSLRVMAATALDRDRLKAEAGIKNTGRKAKYSVYSYSLAWHPDEQGKFDKAQMLDAADQSLKALGAHEHQALIVAHQDEAHPHIHVIVNMVNPKNGKQLSTSNHKNILHKWSNDWRKARGEEHKYTPNKAKKFEAIEERKRGKNPEYTKGGEDTPRHLHEKFSKAQGSANQNELDAAKKQQAGRDAELSQYGRDMHSRHSHQWAALSDNYKFRKKQIAKQYREERKDAIAAIKAQNKQAFSTTYRDQWQEQRSFERREKRLSGKLKNMAEAAQYAKMVRGEEGNEGILNQVFNFLSSAANRQNWLKERHSNELRELRTHERQQITDATRQLKEARDRRFKSAREDFTIDRQGMIAKQRNDKEDLKHRWRHRNEQRKRTLDALKKKDQAQKKERYIDGELYREADNTKKEFKDRTQKKERKRTRSRKRTRKRDDG